jgi:CheY-like chemotaxis protein
MYDESNGYNLSNVFSRYVINHHARNTSSIPLFLTTCPAVRLRAGFTVPSEFVLSVFELDRLVDRITQLQIIHPNGVKSDDLRAFCLGAFRRYLFLDDENHGQGELDLTEVRAGRYRQWDPEAWHKRYRNRFEQAEGNEEDPLLSAYRILFSKEVKEIPGKLKTLCECVSEEVRRYTSLKGPKEDVVSQIVLSAADSFERALPRKLGHALRFYSVPEKSLVLLLDDKADQVAQDLENLHVPPSPENESGPTRRMLDFFDIDPCIIKPGVKGEQLGEVLRNALLLTPAGGNDTRRFYLILLDLCLGEPRGAEPLGYQLLPILRKFFPDIPIIAFTRFGDMGHIEQAFSHGATWFLPKSDAWKLPEHYLERIQDPAWQREWQSIREQIEWDVSVGSQFDENTLFLIWKAIESMPGSCINVRKLGDGIGGAQTLSASRLINGRYDMAAPVVIKIDDYFRMLLERERYQRFICPYLSNLAGRIEQPLARGGYNQASISYTYAGKSQGRSSEGRRGREVLTLENLLHKNLPSGHDDILLVDPYEKLLDALLLDILPRIHFVDPRPEPSELDYPNSIFEESESALDSYLLRMPPEAVVSVERPFNSETNDCINATIDNFEGLHENQNLLVSVYDIEHNKESFIKAAARLKDGNMHRLDLKGLLGHFFAEHRHLRPMQPLVVSLTGKPTSLEQQAWERLWSPHPVVVKPNCPDKYPASLTKIEGQKNICRYTFESASLTSGSLQLAKEVVSLRRWLTAQQGPKALSGGRIGILHGDMNLGNIIVERRRGAAPEPVDNTAWLIDFARTRRDRIVIDYTQLEVDLAMRLISPELFPLLNDDDRGWDDVTEFFSHLLETPWIRPRIASKIKRLGFIYSLMKRIREAAERNGVAEKEYLVSRNMQYLITHKILCGRWKKKPHDKRLQFCCVLSLKLAFENASLLGWTSSE